MTVRVFEKGKIVPETSYITQSGSVVHMSPDCHYLINTPKENLIKIKTMDARAMKYSFCTHCDLVVG